MAVKLGFVYIVEAGFDVGISQLNLSKVDIEPMTNNVAEIVN
jgi:hypothetical protein